MDYLFVYGTLLKSMNTDMSRFLYNNSEIIGNAYIHGRLYGLEGYPGAIVSQNPFERV